MYLYCYTCIYVQLQETATVYVIKYLSICQTVHFTSNYFTTHVSEMYAFFKKSL